MAGARFATATQTPLLATFFGPADRISWYDTGSAPSSASCAPKLNRCVQEVHAPAEPVGVKRTGVPPAITTPLPFKAFRVTASDALEPGLCNCTWQVNR